VLPPPATYSVLGVTGSMMMLVSSPPIGRPTSLSNQLVPPLVVLKAPPPAMIA
jgi:hypothetical protein